MILRIKDYRSYAKAMGFLSPFIGLHSGKVSDVVVTLFMSVCMSPPSTGVEMMTEEYARERPRGKLRALPAVLLVGK